MRSPLAAFPLVSLPLLVFLVAACGGRTHVVPIPIGGAADSTVRYYARQLAVAEPGEKAALDSGNRISRDSARALLGDFLFRDLLRTLADARFEQQVAVEDWALPPRTVFAMRVRGDSVTPRGLLITNGRQVSITGEARRAVTYANMVQMMKDIHMNPRADYLIDTVRATAAQARAAVDSGKVARVEFIKPRPPGVPPTPASFANGAIRLLTWPKRRD